MKILNFIKSYYYSYKILFGLTMLDPWEVKLLSIVLLLLIVILYRFYNIKHVIYNNNKGC